MSARASPAGDGTEPNTQISRHVCSAPEVMWMGGKLGGEPKKGLEESGKHYRRGIAAIRTLQGIKDVSKAEEHGVCMLRGESEKSSI